MGTRSSGLPVPSKGVDLDGLGLRVDLQPHYYPHLSYKSMLLGPVVISIFFNTRTFCR